MLGCSGVLIAWHVRCQLQLLQGSPSPTSRSSDEVSNASTEEAPSPRLPHFCAGLVPDIAKRVPVYWRMEGANRKGRCECIKIGKSEQRDPRDSDPELMC